MKRKYKIVFDIVIMGLFFVVALVVGVFGLIKNRFDSKITAVVILNFVNINYLHFRISYMNSKGEIVWT